LRATDCVAHLRGEKIGAVIAHAGVALELDNRQRLERVDAEVKEVLELEEDVQERAAPRSPSIRAAGIGSVVRADVELVDDEVAKVGKPKALIMPGVGARIADDAVAIGPGGIKSHFAGVRIALEALAARPHDEKAIRIAIVHAGHEAAPETVGILRQE